jgi:deazaflavin-dependent oxidoreductase (nitroreductase family)
MPEGHALFAVTNRTVNHAVKAVLRSPAHGALSKRLVVMTVTGRRSGKRHSFPVAYEQDGPDHLRIHLDWPEKKVWWRNLKAPAPVSVRLRGEQRTGVGEAQGDPKTDLWVDVRLDPR